MKIGFLVILASLLVAANAQLRINLLSMFSLSRIEDGERLSDDSDLLAFVHALALTNRMNAAPLNEEFEILPGIVETYTCDVEFVHTLLDTKSDFSSALTDLSELNLTEYDFVLGPSRSSTCVPVSFVTSTFRIPVMSPSCTSPELDDTKAHAFFSRTIPSDEVTAVSMIKLLQQLPVGARTPILEQFSGEAALSYTRVAVLYQEDTYGSNFKDSLFENVENDEIDFFFIPFTPGNDESIRDGVRNIAETELNVILGLFFADDIRIAVDEARSLGIFSEEQVWIFSDGILTAQEFLDGLNFGSNGEPVGLDILRDVNNTFLVQASGQVDNDLIDEFQRRAFTEEFGYDIDDIESRLNGQLDLGDGDVFGRVLSEMRNHANDPIVLTDFSLFAFDMIIAIRKYLEVIECDVPGNVDADDFLNFLLNLEANGVEIQGITGQLLFDASHSRDGTTSAFKLLNTRFDGETAVDVLVGEFVGENWNIFDDRVLFNNGGINAPLAFDPPQDVEQNEIEVSIRNAMYGLTTVVLGITATIAFATFMLSNRQVIRAAQPVFLFLMLIGVVVSTVSIYMFPQAEDSGTDAKFKCNVPYFFISLGLTISYGSLVCKLQRVIQVANDTPDLVGKNKGDSPYGSILLLAGLVTVDVAIFLITFVVSPLDLAQREVTVDDFGQPTETFDVCSPTDNDNAGIYALYFLFHFVFYIYGFRLISKARKLSSDFQEGRWIILSVVSQFQLYLLGLPVVIAVGVDNPGVRFLVISLLVLLSNVILIGLIFGPKFIRVITGDDKVTWQTSRHDKKTDESNLIYTGDNDDDQLVESYRRSLVNTMKTDEFGG